MRVWDVEQGGDALAVLENLPSRPQGPGLAVWHTGDEKKNLRVAIAWPETDLKSVKGALRLWDVTAGKIVRSPEAGPWNSTAALLDTTGDEPRVVSGTTIVESPEVQIGGLRVWRFSKDPGADLKEWPSVRFTFDRVAHRMYALAPLSAESDGRFTHVAAVLQPNKEGLDYVLALTDVSAGNPVTISRHFSLENTDLFSRPVVAASPRGRWLAVAISLDGRMYRAAVHIPFGTTLGGAFRDRLG